MCYNFFFRLFTFQFVFKRIYEPEEEKLRFLIFRANVKRIVEINEKYANGEITWKAEINQFTDKKPGEYPSGGFLPRQ